MLLPDELKLTAEEIRYLRPAQLAALTNIQSNSFSAWSAARRLTEPSLEAIASSLGIGREEVLKAFDLRREDYALSKAAQKKAAQLLAYLQLEKESA